MFHTLTNLVPLRGLTAALLLTISAAPPLQAEAVNVRILGPASSYTSHNAAAIAVELHNILTAATGYAGSSAAATEASGRSLTEAYYHPSYRTATRAAVAGNYDYLVLLPETEFLFSYPEMVFDGVLQMSKKALDVGTTPLLLMPGVSAARVNTLGTHTYRIANGCGINAVPGGYATQTGGLLAPGTALDQQRQAYLLAAILFTKITGLNAAATGYVSTFSGTALDVANLAAIAASTLTTHRTNSHYSTSRENSGLVRYRTITPANNTVRYAWTGTSTETGINGALSPILQASGYTVGSYKVTATRGWSDAITASAATNFATYPNQYLFAYARDPDIATQGQSLIDSNQANILPIAYDQHYTGLNLNNALDDIYERSNGARSQCLTYGWATVPVHLAVARLNDVDPAIVVNADTLHWSTPVYNMIAAMMATSALGREPTPSATILANPQWLTGFNEGKKTVKQLAFLSETQAYVPDTTLAIGTQPLPEVVKGSSFNHTLTASNGTPPYTWSEESTTGLPAGLTLSPGGQLSGVVTADAGSWKLVLRVKGSTGAIRKIPQTLTVKLIATSANAYLSSLASSAGSLAPAFNSEVFDYTATVQPSTNTIAVTPTAVVSTATITVNGSPVASGNPSAPLSLNFGANAITTQVVSQDLSTTKIYVLTVTRPAPSSDADLSSLVSNNVTFSPSFASNTISYTGSVPFETESLTVTPTAAETYAIISVNGSPVSSGTPSGTINLNVGSNVITTAVSSSDLSVTKTYTLTVTRTASIFRWWDGGSSTIVTTGDAVSQGSATGVWDTATQNWDQGNNQVHVPWNNTDGNIAIFGGTAGTVTAQNVTVGGMIFTSAYTVTGGAITFPSAGTISNSAAVTISSALAGAVVITKSGTGTLSLPNVANNYSGGTAIAGGTIASIGNGSLGTGPVTFTGNGGLTPASGAFPVLSNSLEVSNAIATINSTSSAFGMTFTGALSGAGTLQVTMANAASTLPNAGFTHATNNFTGTLIATGAGTVRVNSLADSANPIRLGVSSVFELASGTASSLLFTNRPIQLTGAAGTATLRNNNGNSANIVSISQNLGYTSVTGNKTLALEGSNTGSNVFAGNLAAPAGYTLSLTKSGTGLWALRGTNTYSGATTVNAGGGTLIFQGQQSLSATTLLTQIQSSSNASTLKLLMDAPNNSTISLPNTFNLNHNNSSISSVITVGNNSTANGGSSGSSTSTGVTVAFNKLTFANPVPTLSGWGSINGANGYRLQFNNVDFPTLTGLATAATWTIRLSPGSAPLTLGGTIKQLNGNTKNAAVLLELSGTAKTNLVTGNIMDADDFSGANSTPISTTAAATKVSKTDTGIWTLSGANAYTGTTTVSAGKLFINGDQSAATGNLTVAAGATLGGTGTLGGNTTIVANGNLEFALATDAANHHKLELGAGKTLTFSGASVLTLTSSGPAFAGDYTLVSAPGGFGNSAPPATVILPAGWLADAPRFVGSDLKFNITSIGSGPGPVDHFAISPVASPQTVGSPIPGITLTAQDAANQTVTSFTGTVNFGGTGGFSGTSASFTAGVLNSVSVTPTAAGSNLTLTVTDSASGKTGSTTIATINPIPPPYAAWSGSTLFDADANDDGVKNGVAFLLGAADPNAAAFGLLPSATETSSNLVLNFRCRNAASRGSAVLNVQYSSDLSDPWTAAVVPETTSTVNGVSFIVTQGSPLNTVTATLPSSEAAIGKGFGRLKATP